MRYLNFIILLFTILSCNSSNDKPIAKIIPEPKLIVQKEGTLNLEKGAKLYIENEQFLYPASLLDQWVTTEISKDTSSLIKLKYDATIEIEGYVLEIDENNIVLRASTSTGMLYAVQSLRQLLPISIENGAFINADLPYVYIKDQPSFSWRGMHLDVSRHFMPMSFVKKYIDYLEMHKMNVFHWHLVDGVGWRIEIKKYPKLTDWGAWRVKKNDTPWIDFEVWKEGDDRPKDGGFYTQEEAKEIVAYAAKRGITVVPEIELPGHSEVVFQCYPALMCSNVEKNIGVYCAGNPKAYTFLENILDEIMVVFPSEYIHIGGDEVNKENWKLCKKCQRLKKKENLIDEHEIQSYFVNHFGEYLQKNNRKLIGWHEILEGKLDKTATIMYWGSQKEVKQTLEEGHPTVLTTGDVYYFDHYQSLSSNEPKAFGGYSSLKKVYDYQPIPTNVTTTEKENILGVQANVWTEYMPTPSKVEYMLFPRMTALAENAWNAGEDKDWNNFSTKAEYLFERYDILGINYSKSAYAPKIEVNWDKKRQKTVLDITTELPSDVYYTLDGSVPNEQSSLYSSPVILDQNVVIKAIAYKNNQKVAENPEVFDAIIHEGKQAKLTLLTSPYEQYSANGSNTLQDLNFGADKWGNGKWLGFLDQPMELLYEWEEPINISTVGVNCIEEQGAGIYFPSEITVEGSEDGNKFISLGKSTLPHPPKEKKQGVRTSTFEIDIPSGSFKYIKVKATPVKRENEGVFIFVDEVILNAITQ